MWLELMNVLYNLNENKTQVNTQKFTESTAQTGSSNWFPSVTTHHDTVTPMQTIGNS